MRCTPRKKRGVKMGIKNRERERDLVFCYDFLYYIIIIL